MREGFLPAVGWIRWVAAGCGGEAVPVVLDADVQLGEEFAQVEIDQEGVRGGEDVGVAGVSETYYV